MSQVALRAGWGIWLALLLAAIQAVVCGALLWGALPGRARWAGVALGAMLLTGLGWGAGHAPITGLTVAAGLSHACLYAGLLAVFARTLGPGRVPLISGFAARINPHFTPAMARYTRHVTVMWCAFFAGQLMVSGLLAVVSPPLWAWFVTGLHAPLNLVMAAGEYAWRCYLFRGQPHSRIADMVRAVRAGALR